MSGKIRIIMVFDLSPILSPFRDFILIDSRVSSDNNHIAIHFEYAQIWPPLGMQTNLSLYGHDGKFPWRGIRTEINNLSGTGPNNFIVFICDWNDRNGVKIPLSNYPILSCVRISFGIFDTFLTGCFARESMILRITHRGYNNKNNKSSSRNIKDNNNNNNNDNDNDNDIDNDNVNDNENDSDNDN